MRLLLVGLLILWMHLGDLVTAWLYDGGAWPAATYLRPARDLLVMLLAALCLCSVRLPVRLLAPLLAYIALAVAYLLPGSSVDLGIRIGSLGTLLIPALFFLAGYYGVRNTRHLRDMVVLLVLLGLASTAFGLWERQHTEFWTQQLAYPIYLREVKGMLLGANPYTGMPWNFYGDNSLGRRAAGLLAAPLAQGMFLAITGVLAVAVLQRRARALGLLCCTVLFLGIWMSGTRGAMLAGALALLGYLATARGLLRNPLERLLLTLGASLAVLLASYQVVYVSINFLDGSTIGHWLSLLKNLEDLPRVLLLGAGLGQQGGPAAQAETPAIGGGEGALFSVAFQIGVPGALLLLVFMLQCGLDLWRRYQGLGDPLALALLWLAVGLSSTLISSEHLLTVSGGAAFWLLLGAALRSLPLPARETAPAERPACAARD